MRVQCTRSARAVQRFPLEKHPRRPLEILLFPLCSLLYRAFGQTSQTALRRTTLSDPQWEVQENTTQRMKHLRDENPNETHKRHKTEELDVPRDLRDMEIPLEDMGDVIVLTGL